MVIRFTWDEEIVRSNRITPTMFGDMFFAYTGDSLYNKMFNTISICHDGAFLVHDEWGECQTLVEIEKVKSIHRVVNTREKEIGEKLFDLSW